MIFIDYEKTSLSPYIKYFDKFVQSILKETLAKNKGIYNFAKREKINWYRFNNIFLHDSCHANVYGILNSDY